MFRLPILTEDHIKQIHQASLRILSETGVVLTHPDAREMLTDHGASLKGDRTLLPVSLVETCLGKLPQSVNLQGRDPEQPIDLSTGASRSMTRSDQRLNSRN